MVGTVLKTAAGGGAAGVRGVDPGLKGKIGTEAGCSNYGIRVSGWPREEMPSGFSFGDAKVASSNHAIATSPGIVTSGNDTFFTWPRIQLWYLG
jgi:hypothetical protein